MNLERAEVQLIDLLSRFPGEVQRAATEYKPLIIASSAYDIAKAFAGFYDACPVVQAEPGVRVARLRPWQRRRSCLPMRWGFWASPPQK